MTKFLKTTGWILLISLFVFLGLFLKYRSERTETLKTAVIPLDLIDIISIYDKRDTISWDYLKEFTYDERESNKKETVYKSVYNDFKLRVQGEFNNGHRPKYIYLSPIGKDSLKIDILKDNPTGFIKENKDEKLGKYTPSKYDEIIEAVIKNKSDFKKNANEEPLFESESHKILNYIEESRGKNVTRVKLQLVVMNESYGFKNKVFSALESVYDAVEITVDIDSKGYYNLVDYWMQEDGEAGYNNLTARFGEKLASDSESLDLNVSLAYINSIKAIEKYNRIKEARKL